MKSSTHTAIVLKTISEEQHQLVLTFTPEEVQALISLGGTSQMKRRELLNQAANTPKQHQHNELCATLLGEVFHAAKKHLAGS